MSALCILQNCWHTSFTIYFVQQKLHCHLCITVLQVVRIKHMVRDNTISLVLGCGSKKEHQIHPAQINEFKKQDVPIKRKLWECRVTEDALLPVGTALGASHFKAGQYLDITGVTKGKGFAGEVI